MNRIASALLVAWCVALLVRHGSRRPARRAGVQRLPVTDPLSEHRARVSPHLLLNALNSVAVLAEEENAPRVLDATSRLARLLHAALEHDAPLISLRREKLFLQRYAAVEQVRFGDRLRIAWEIGEDCMDACVPALLLQPLVENAVHHGMTPDTGIADITVAVARTGRRLRVRVQDRGPGPDQASREGRGIGMTRRQLELLYPGDYTLTLSGRAGGGSEVTVNLPLVLNGAWP